MATRRIFLAFVVGAGCTLLPAFGSAGRLAAGETLPDQGDQPAVWRTPSHDGANCLYLFLSLSGRKADYTDVTAALEASGRGSSLAGLHDAARRLGMNVSVYKWRPDQLVQAPTPVIAYVDSYRGDGGYFTLIIQATERRCSLLNGAKVTIEEMGSEDFRHVWSGYVLAPTEPHSAKTELLSCGIGVILLAGYAWFRVRPALAVPGPGSRSKVA